MPLEITKGGMSENTSIVLIGIMVFIFLIFCGFMMKSCNENTFKNRMDCVKSGKTTEECIRLIN